MKLFLLFVILLSLPLAHAQMTLGDLGISQKTEVTPVDPKLEQQMEIRASKLKTHEILGLATWGLMTATLFTGGSALDGNLHPNLGFATGALYLATAYYSLTAPKPTQIKDKARMKWHKALAWIHFPLMLLVPYTGTMYKRHENDHKSHSGLEKQHATLAGILYGSFTLSAALMVIEF